MVVDPVDLAYTVVFVPYTSRVIFGLPSKRQTIVAQPPPRYSRVCRRYFHARYGNNRAVVRIRTLKAMSNLSPRVLGFVLEWTRLHQQELLENWERARRGEELLKIEPLE